MIFKRKVYKELLEWKLKHGRSYAALLEGPRRVGKSTIAEEFARNEFKSHIIIDFANVSRTTLDVFSDISNLNLFFQRLQLETGVLLYEGESVIVFDEIQRAPLVRQAIKYLVKDGRYYYIETGSLISIKKNVKDIVIPSEEHRIAVYPMDYEEFLEATGNNTYPIIRNIYKSDESAGDAIHRTQMRNFRAYMAVGGMPQAVKAYAEGKSFAEIDDIKRKIIELYEEDFNKIDSSGRISKLYDAIPSQLMLGRKNFSISNVLSKKVSKKDEELLSDLIDSKTVLISYNTTDPSIALNQTKDSSSYKLFLADTGLFVTLLFRDESKIYNDIYKKLLSNNLNINLGYLFENVVAQMITAAGRRLFYHTWKKDGSTHFYEIDFLISKRAKVIPLEIKSSNTRFHDSITEFAKKYSSKVGEQYLLSQKDVKNEGNLQFKPIYMIPFILEE